jgi:glycosyltransferase involved in cell wall biosynthesis
MKICHLTSAHANRYDTRIFLKECITLAKSYTVVLIVADGKKNEVKNKVEIIDVGKKNTNKYLHFIFTSYSVFRKAFKLKADLYHIHDPELIPYAFMLTLLGKKVIYDIHEYLPLQILSKQYIPKILRKPISLFFDLLEKLLAKFITAVVVALPPLYEKFLKYNGNTVLVNNYPFKNELMQNQEKTQNSNSIIFIGGITPIRGLKFVIDALKIADVNLILAGSFSSDTYRNECESSSGWINTVELGFVPRENLVSELSKSFAGMVTYLDVPNHRNAQPTKLFEYMSVGIPVIASDFPYWKQIVEGNQCGICVDPTNPVDIAKSILYLKKHPQAASEMGENGRNAVLTRYNWENESIKLTNLYHKII